MYLATILVVVAHETPLAKAPVSNHSTLTNNTNYFRFSFPILSPNLIMYMADKNYAEIVKFLHFICQKTPKNGIGIVTPCN